MPVYQFNSIFAGLSGLPTDQYVNTWHFYTAGTGADFDNVRDLLEDFFVTTGSGSPLRTHMPTTLNLLPRVVGYDLSDPKPRSPVYEETFKVPVTYGTGTALPNEVALCLSFEAKKVSGQPQARRRNRVYLGPFRAQTNAATGRPDVTFLNDVKRQARTLYDAAKASSTWQWVVYSPTDDQHHEIDHLWCDDAWDTQRRRGLDPAQRYEHTGLDV